MKDLSLHLLDIIENSAKAGATCVTVCFNRSTHTLTLTISDNGPGMPQIFRRNPGDPYQTTRITRKVGLGLSLLKEAAEQTGGTMIVAHPQEGGVRIEAIFDMSHVDAKPLGDLAEAFSTAIAAWPNLDLIVRLPPSQDDVFNTKTIKAELQDVPLTYPSIRQFIAECLIEALTPLHAWAADIAFQTMRQGDHAERRKSD